MVSAIVLGEFAYSYYHGLNNVNAESLNKFFGIVHTIFNIFYLTTV